MFHKTFAAIATSILVIFVAAPAAPAKDRAAEATAVAEAYFKAVETSDLDAAGKLFAAESSVFETGGVEGSWSHYREHHLGPEVDAIESFVIERKDPEVIAGKQGGLTAVAWPIAYTIKLNDGRVIESKGTVTFVLAREGESLRIRHLHWSSRKIRK